MSDDSELLTKKDAREILALLAEVNGGLIALNRAILGDEEPAQSDEDAFLSKLTVWGHKFGLQMKGTQERILALRNRFRATEGEEAESE